jgi:hypothetical protein
MTDDLRNEMTLAAWEDEGGNPDPALRESAERRDGAAHVLPPGCEAQPLCGFHDQTGRFSYQFHRVYGPPRRRDRRGPLTQLDEQLSYWAVTWSTSVKSAAQHLKGRWLSYAQARKLRGPNLTFEGFSSMRDQLPELLEVGDVSLEAIPTTA